ncbi:TKL/LISK/LISK-DD1 protein kinase [Aphanomyces invadans]|uniref:TKL/LISK/LISK-DD1 protein kinase n=1 Tax=Aphanomyces invadans TaxID=157072 RepID=A0A024UTI2_9STRA|nr:TKL/LISK/LISK-DD1 protein kinase [Aphanomyces invadans]ETW08923.1 TKL/LISK/LISK-DD1 protein kinase [Aphanomyces invadans]|eukprot:XP_008862728.1 TKL/LISK/LISK-DD1 protein kinase [Aphanomyces invadans]
MWTVFEYIPGGDLTRALATLSWSQRAQVALDIASALAYLHDNDIVHRDVKCANILLHEDCRARLCDFGFARRLDDDATSLAGEPPCGPRRKRCMTVCGTDVYMAPELYFDEPFDERVDVFSFGVVLIELITRQMVHCDGYLRRTPANHFAIDIDEFRSHVPRTCPASLVCLAEMCVAVDSDMRPTALEIVEWLQDLKAELDDGSSDCDTVCTDDDDDGSCITPPTTDASFVAFEGTLWTKEAGHFRDEWQSSFVSVCNGQVTVTTKDKTTVAALTTWASVAMSPDAPNQLVLRMHVADGSGDMDVWVCQASTALEAQLWRAKLDHAIKTAKAAQSQNFDNSRHSIVVVDEVYTWLSNVGLSCYFATFKAKGFASLAFLREV